jgi:DNA end-binding protein Ku
MAARAYWSGHIRLSLVTCPVKLYSAIETGGGRIRFNQIHKPTGERVRTRPYVEGEGPVDRDDIVKGYEHGKGNYVLVEKEELDDLRVESSHTIDIVQFVDEEEIDPVYYDKPYYLAPDGKVGVEAYVTIREALQQSGKVALGQVSFAGREHIAAIRPCGRGLLLETLHYANEVRAAEPVFDSVPEVEIDEDQLDLAQVLIERKAEPFDPSRFVDHYEEAVRELVEAKIEHRAPQVEEAREPAGNVVNIMDALKRSLEAEEGGKPKTGPKKGGKRKAAPQEAEPEEAGDGRRKRKKSA